MNLWCGDWPKLEYLRIYYIKSCAVCLFYMVVSNWHRKMSITRNIENKMKDKIDRIL